MHKPSALIPLVLILSRCASTPPAPSVAELVAPGIVSTDRTEIRVTFDSTGDRMLWGWIGAEDQAGGWQILESTRSHGTWSPAHHVSFNSEKNDFDPFFAPDDSGVYFFSNRDGGFGGDDLYFASYDRLSRTYGPAVNLGPRINTAKDEWAPSVTKDHRLLFSSDGHGGAGKHDLFVAEQDGSTWSAAVNLESINGPDEDFDATFLPDGSIVFTSGNFDTQVELYVARLQKSGGFAPREKLNSTINTPDGWTMGPAVSPSEPGVLYFSTHREGDPAHMNIYRIAFR